MATKELTEDNPFKLIILFMLPIFFGNIFQQMYHLADALIVGRIIGLKALAAVGATSPMIFLFISFIFASTQGFTVITAQRFGAGDYLGVKKSAAASFILSFFLTIIITLLSAPFTRFMLEILNTPSDIMVQAEKYLFIMFIGIFATVFYNVTSNLVRALGDSKTPLYFLIFSTIVNIIMDLLFIIKFGWGIEGAGWATVVSQALSTVFCLIYMIIKFPLLRLNKEDFKVSLSFLYEHLKIGIPMGFQMSILTIGIIILQYVLNGFGSIAVASFTTAVRVEQFFTQSFLALGVSVATFTAQNFGANKFARIRQGAHASVLIALFISIFSIIMISCFGTTIVGWFLNEPNEEVISLAKEYLDIVMIFFFFLGLLLIYRNLLQGIGKVVAPLLSGVSELIMRALGALVLGHYFNYTGICYATPLAWISAAIVLYMGYKLSIKKLQFKI